MIAPGNHPPLATDYLAEAERRARRFAGCWDQGTSGTLAADVVRLLRDRARILATLEHPQEPAMPCAPSAITEKGPWPDPEDLDVDDGDEGRLALEHAAAAKAFAPYARPPAAEPRPPAEELLLTSAATVRERRTNYGPPADHFTITIGLLNAALGAKLRARLAAGREPFELTDWPLIMALDKIARYMGPGRSADVAVDLAGYAGCLHECEKAAPGTD